MYYLYIIYSKKLNRYYVGYSHEVSERLRQHNSKDNTFSRFTKAAVDWKVVYTEEYVEKSAAIKREKEIKSWHSRKLIEELINDAG